MSGRSKPFDVARLERTLLPCPFCGSVAELVHSRRRDYCKSSHCQDIRYWYVRCTNQGCLCHRGTSKFPNDMEVPVKIWNRRHHD